ncbi:winged helix-turn-helix domain-containing protein [Spiractinospora alimapuensis]|uniref:BTAD domain-containing putative transcriptional regulator n=1 Tax=Spiractinospora alimapuensis TaxID=2820884 RepID=UPI001F2A4761|nr:BTAD domain-containing putative transcriptional regulator [Spiractinospora alimapuensis]QVQ53793.1 winged helix-turn-helix domain-containing protein [Spiractinospora alimapuensis]
MRFGILGPLVLWDESGAPVPIPEAKVRSLLAALLAREGGAVSADRLVEDLWGRSLPANPARVLRAKVSRLRGVLAEVESDGRDRLRHGSAGYQLRVAMGDVDALRFAAMVRWARKEGDPRARATQLDEALALWRGPALAGLADEEFAAPLAARLEDERLSAQEDRAEAHLALGGHPGLADELAAVVAEHPLRDRLRAAHMRALYQSGRQADALASFDDLRHRLSEELGVDPGPEVLRLHQEILRQDENLNARNHEPASPTALAEAPTVRVTASPRSAPPRSVDSTIAREHEISEVRSALLSGRFVTLTGIGGVGKTRIALEVAHQPPANHPADQSSPAKAAPRAWWIELGALSADATKGDVLDAMETGVGVREATSSTGVAALASAVGSGLLVLDNCEHVIDATADIVHDLLRIAPELRVLATSREPLNVEGEVVYPVPPLTVPAEGETPTVEDALPAAMRLFVRRAAAAAPGFRLDDGNVDAVAAICRRLDGLPLALELAANAVRSLGVAELAKRLDDRFSVLASPKRGAPQRQRTLRAMIDWSWELLDEVERTVLRRMSVHVGGCTLDAAERITDGPTLVPGGVVGPLSRLVERSLIAVTHAETGTRYRLLESIRAYAHDRLVEAGEAAALAEEHLNYYTDLAQHADGALRGGEQRFWLIRLDEENANLRAALDHTLRTGDSDGALRLAAATYWYRWLRGRYGEAKRVLEEALTLDGGDDARRAVVRTLHAAAQTTVREPVDWATVTDEAIAALDPEGNPTLHGRILAHVATVLVEAGEVAAADRHLRTALDLVETTGDVWGRAAVLCGLVWVRSFSDIPSSERSVLAQESLALFTQVEDQWGQLQAMATLSHATEPDGVIADLPAMNREGVRIADGLGMLAEKSFWLSVVASDEADRGDYTTARETLERSQRLAIDIGYVFGERYAELSLGMLARRAGRHADAAAHLETYLADERFECQSADVVLAYTERGYTAELMGDLDEAFRYQWLAIDHATAHGPLPSLAQALQALASTLAAAGHPIPAARLLGATHPYRGSHPTPLTDSDDVARTENTVKAALGAEALAQEFIHGQAMDLHETAEWASSVGGG